MPFQAGALELAGRVVDTGARPIAGARVELQRVLSYYERAQQILKGESGWDAAVTARTSTDGGFRLVVPEGGMWQVEVSAAGKVPMRCRLVPLLVDQALPDAVLEADAGLEVRVVDDDGSALEGAQVWLQPARADRRRFRGQPISPWRAAGRYGRTGEDGRLRLARPAGQQVRVHAFRRGFLPGESADLDTAEATLRLRSGSPVTLRVRSVSDAPVSKAVVTATSPNWVTSATDESGEAIVFVEPGRPRRLSLRQAAGRVESIELLIAAPDSAAEKATRAVREWRLPAPVELSGRVIDEDTREALGGALVWSSNDVGAFQVTGADGRYRLARGAADRWAIRAAAPGYSAATVETLREPGGVRVPTLALARAGALNGRVADPLGEAIADALVRVRAIGESASTPTDANGAFRLGGLALGRTYEVAIEAAGFAPEHRRLTLEPGRAVEIVLHPGSSVSGRLVTPDQEPVVGGRVFLVPTEMNSRLRTYSSATAGFSQTESDSKGRFRLDELPRRLMVLVARGEGLAEHVLRDVDLNDGETERDLGDIELGWGIELRGTVHSRDGQPIEDAEVTIFGETSDPLLWGVRFEREEPGIVKTNGQGRFVVDGLDRNRKYDASVRHPDYVPRGVSGIEPGAGKLVEIVLDRGARISGRVLDDAGSPVENVSISVRTLAWAGPSAEAIPQDFGTPPGVSRADGSFEVTGISAGRIEISVGSGFGWVGYEPLVITLAAGEERDGLILRVTSGSELTGTVTDEQGRPVVGATIWVSSRVSVSPFPTMQSTVRGGGGGRTDGDGIFAVRGLDPAFVDVVVSVRHPDFALLEQIFGMRSGENRLDLRLRRGAALTGVVVTDGGEPVEGAQVELETAGSVVIGGSHRAETGRDGSFEIGGLGFGAYRLRASKPGFAASAPQSVEVGKDGAAHVTLTLLRGGTIRGRILGLEGDQLTRVVVTASDKEASHATGLVGEDGEYRIPYVGFPTGRVTASSEGRGQAVSAEFTLDPQGGEAWVDLEFGAGSSLSGLVLLDGEPMVDARIVARGGNEGVGWSKTDALGHFRIQGLEDGPYQVRVSSENTLSHTKAVRVVGDTDVTIEISSVRISGRVIAEDDREPVAGAWVSATAEGDVVPWFAGARTVTTIGGEFELNVPVGRRLLLRARAPGYAEGSDSVDTASGERISGIELALPRGVSLDLDVALWTGVSPGLVNVALLDATGVAVVADALMGQPPGRFRLDSAPPGDWTLLVAAEQSAVVARTVTVPGPSIDVVLPQGGKVSIEISNPGGEALGKTVRLVGPTGGVFRLPGHERVLSEIPVFGGRAEIPFVPAGDWVVELVDPVGEVRRQAVTTLPGKTSTVTFE